MSAPPPALTPRPQNVGRVFGLLGYQPVPQGIVAVLPHVDHCVAGHSLATYAELTEVIANA